MLLFNYGYYEFWQAYDPANDYYGPQKVTFDGPTLTIYINPPETEIDVKVDLYSNWKEWVQVRDHAKYPQAFSAVGGDPITATLALGTTYFLENGWRLKPYVGDYVLTVDGNLFTREEGANPVIPTTGVSVNFFRSNLVDLIEPTLEGSQVDLSNTALTNIADNVWDEVVNTKGTTARDQLGNKIATKTQDIALS